MRRPYPRPDLQAKIEKWGWTPYAPGGEWYGMVQTDPDSHGSVSREIHQQICLMIADGKFPHVLSAVNPPWLRRLLIKRRHEAFTDFQKVVWNAIIRGSTDGVRP